jgi:hypothetical protein
METKAKSEAASDYIVIDENVATYETAEAREYEFSNQLINQKLQDFYDLMALQNEHPEFNEEVKEQLKNFTNDSISNFITNDFFILKNIQQQGHIIIVNDSVQKVKLSFDKVSDNTRKTDTIYAIITKKRINVDDETLISNKIQFSKH